MTIIVQEPVELTAAAAAVGGTVPDGVQRIFRSVGAHNDTGAPVTLVVNLVGQSGASRIINRSVPDGKTDMCPELVGRGLNAGGSLQASGLGLNFGFTSIDTTVG